MASPIKVLICDLPPPRFAPRTRPVDPDHGPLGNHEAELIGEINRLKAENEALKIKLSRMCGDA